MTADLYFDTLLKESKLTEKTLCEPYGPQNNFGELKKNKYQQE